MASAPAPIDLSEARLAKVRADYLARVRANVPERRAVVKHQRGIVWKQDAAHLAKVLAVKVERELA